MNYCKIKDIRMKRLAVFIAALFAITSMYAQYDQKAKEILDKVSVKTKSYSTIKIEYVLTHENIEENIKESSNGTLDLKGNMYKLLFMGNTIMCDSKTVWTYLKEANEVNISSIEEEDDEMFNPATMLSIYEEGFKYKFMQERFERGRALYIIDLYPEDVENTAYSKVRLYIDKDKYQIFQIHYFSKDENRFIIELKDFKSDVSMPDTMFQFDKKNYPGVEVVDLR